jgi:hypothetical protein
MAITDTTVPKGHYRLTRDVKNPKDPADVKEWQRNAMSNAPVWWAGTLVAATPATPSYPGPGINVVTFQDATVAYYGDLHGSGRQADELVTCLEPVELLAGVLAPLRQLPLLAVVALLVEEGKLSPADVKAAVESVRSIAIADPTGVGVRDIFWRNFLQFYG